VSIKFRHGEHLEFKVREKQHESGAELWRKIEFHDVCLRKKTDTKILQGVVAEKLELIASKYDESSDERSFLTRAAQHIKDNWKCIEVVKNRQNGHHAGVHVEQTNISLTGSDDKWLTICFEGSLENILKFLASSHGKGIIETGYRAKGYPEFLCTIKQ